MCFTDHRIQFIAEKQGQKGNGATQGGAFVYLGNDPERFALIFRPFGRVVLPDTRVIRCSGSTTVGVELANGGRFGLTLRDNGLGSRLMLNDNGLTLTDKGSPTAYSAHAC